MKRRTEWTNERPCEVVDPSITNPWEKPVQDADDL